MKRFWLLLLTVLLLLTACGNEDIVPTEPTVPTPTEPPAPWIRTQGIPWDDEGILLEIPLTIPDGLHMNAMLDFDGDLLLWSVDNHRIDTSQLEMVVVELDDGTITARREMDMDEYVTPQVLGEDLYLCDRTGGKIYQLNKALEDVRVWTTEPGEGTWNMGSGEKLYIMDAEAGLYVRDLTTGETTPVLEENPEVAWIAVNGNFCDIEYYRADTGASDNAVLDLRSGAIYEPPSDDDYTSIRYMDGAWLCGKYNEGYSYHLTVDGGETMYIPEQEGYMRPLSEGYLLDTTDDNIHLNLYDLDGKLVSGCTVFESGAGYTTDAMIWNESLGGYFFQARGYDESGRLLFWDISKSIGGEDLPLMPLPKPDEVQQQLSDRAKAIGDKYGLTVLVGEDCETQFDEFTATQIADFEAVSQAMNVLERALAVYPEGFLSQLRYSNIRGIQIHLITELMADGSGRYGDGYAAFTQPQWDHYLMVVDIGVSDETTYYHEFSHIIDSYLEWDASQREDALYSEEGWAQWNPDWFTGYSFDYSDEHILYDFEHFIDSYATVKPTEDRARVMEYAMAEYGQWSFEDAEPLQQKLAYYCRCIRDAFDTTGWPETVLWEQYLP